MAERARRSVLVLVSLAVVAAGCAPASGQHEGHDDTIRMTTGANTITDFDDYVADAIGLYDAYDVEVERIETQTAAQSVQLLATEEADIGRGLTNAIQARGRTAGELDFISVGDPMLRPPFVMVTDGATDWEDLNGSKIGVSSITDQTTIVTAGMLDRLDVNKDHIELIPAGGTGSRLAAINAGGIDSSLLLPPVNFESAELGLTEMAFLPEALGADWQFSFTALITTESWAKPNKEKLVRFLQARDDALRWMSDEANRDEAIDILAEYTDTDRKQAEQTYDLVYRSDIATFADRITVSTDSAEGVMTDLESAQLFTADGITAEDVTDGSYAAEARRRNDL